MVSINLAPNFLREAWKVRSRTTNAMRCTSVGLTLCLLLVVSNSFITWRGKQQRASQRNISEIAKIQETIQVRRRDLEQERIRMQNLEALQTARFSVARQVTAISRLVPVGVTLSSLHIGYHQIECSGVARDRAVIGEFASNISTQTTTQDVRVTKLGIVEVERQMFHDFMIQGASSKKTDAGAVDVLRERRDGR